MTNHAHPNSVLAALLSEGLSEGAQNRLTAIHDLCKARFENDERDFSIPTIGKLATEAGLMNGRTLALSAQSGPICLKSSSAGGQPGMIRTQAGSRFGWFPAMTWAGSAQNSRFTAFGFPL